LLLGAGPLPPVPHAAARVSTAKGRAHQGNRNASAPSATASGGRPRGKDSGRRPNRPACLTSSTPRDCDVGHFPAVLVTCATSSPGEGTLERTPRTVWEARLASRAFRVIKA